MSGVWTLTSERIMACPVSVSLIADCPFGETADASAAAKHHEEREPPAAVPMAMAGNLPQEDVG
jgi:hypothetical protein